MYEQSIRKLLGRGWVPHLVACMLFAANTHAMKWVLNMAAVEKLGVFLVTRNNQNKLLSKTYYSKAYTMLEISTLFNSKDKASKPLLFYIWTVFQKVG